MVTCSKDQGIFPGCNIRAFKSRNGPFPCDTTKLIDPKPNKVYKTTKLCAENLLTERDRCI